MQDLVDLYRKQNGLSDDSSSSLCGLGQLEEFLKEFSKGDSTPSSKNNSPVLETKPIQPQSSNSETLRRRLTGKRRESVLDKEEFKEYQMTSSILHPSRKIHIEPGEMWIPMRNEDDCELESTGVPELHLRVSFVSAEQLQKRFWFWIFEQFDTNNDKKINQMELGAIFEAIGSDVTDDSLSKLFKDEDDLPLEKAYELITQSDEWETSESCEKLTREKKMLKAGSLLFRTCPICKECLPFAHDEIVLHLAVCTEGNSAIADKFVLGGFVTEANASRGWLTRLGKYITLGKYQLGSVSGNVLVKVRTTGEIVEEKMPGFVRLGMRVLFQTSAGGSTVRMKRVQKLMKHLTVKQGQKFDSRESVSNIIPFVHFHNINLKEIEASSVHEFRTFNEFFYRKLKAGARSLSSPDPKVAICPADCRCVVYPSVNECTELWVKGSNFSVASMLQDDSLSKKMMGGSIGIFRLAPQDYHRFHSPVNCVFRSVRHVEGSYYTVNPMAVREDINVFTDNIRSVCTLESPEFGTVVYVCIGQ